MQPELNAEGLPDGDSLRKLYDRVTALMRAGLVKACRTPGMGGIAESVLKMALGNRIGFTFADTLSADFDLFAPCYGAFLLELDAVALTELQASAADADEAACDQNLQTLLNELEHAVLLGETTEDYLLQFGEEAVLAISKRKETRRR